MEAKWKPSPYPLPEGEGEKTEARFTDRKIGGTENMGDERSEVGYRGRGCSFMSHPKDGFLAPSWPRPALILPSSCPHPACFLPASCLRSAPRYEPKTPEKGRKTGRRADEQNTKEKSRSKAHRKVPQQALTPCPSPAGRGETQALPHPRPSSLGGTRFTRPTLRDCPVCLSLPWRESFLGIAASRGEARTCAARGKKENTAPNRAKPLQTATRRDRQPVCGRNPRAAGAHEAPAFRAAP